MTIEEVITLFKNGVSIVKISLLENEGNSPLSIEGRIRHYLIQVDPDSKDMP